MSESAQYKRSLLGQRGHVTDSSNDSNAQPDRQWTEDHSTESYTDDYTSSEQSCDAYSHECELQVRVER